MKLPIVLANAQEQRFTCHGCTNCCRELVVHLTPRDREKIDAQNWKSRLGVPPYVPLGREIVLNHQSGGGCVFLADDGKCRIHSEYGGSEKPLACQLYPFTIEPGGWAVRSGVRFDCPTSCANQGSTLASQASSITSLAEQLLVAAPLQFGEKPILLRRGRELSPDEQDALIERLDTWMAQPDVPLVGRLLGLLELANALEAAKLDKVRDQRFVELLDLLLAELPQCVEPEEYEGLEEPTPRQLVLLRHTIFAHCEYVDLERARAPFLKRLMYRLNQLKRAREFSADRDEWNSLFLGAAAINMDAVSRAKPAAADGDADELLTRYLRNRIVAQTAFGPGYYGWPVVDGLRALVLCVAAIGWLARYVAVSRGSDLFAIDDLRRAIAIVDRTAGRAAELGARSARLRIRYLQQDDGILRLLLAFSPGAN